ncbi:MAG TPA: TPM domain-containing protein, partial [Gemmatimonadaceae bacterium]|nr:TPM domain-containing protein [Gemmatimonadaceae bacterium]
MRLSAIAFVSSALLLVPQSLQIPAPVGYVNDFANVIAADKASTIQRIIEDVRAKSGGEIVVVTLPDLGGRPIEDVGLAIGRQWKVGQAGKPGDPARNTGVIILVVPKETSSDGRGHVRTEVGYGAEGFLTDAQTGQFRDEATPYFERRDYGTGIELMTLRVAQRFADEFHFTIDSSFHAPPPAPPSRTTQTRSQGIPPFVWLILFFVVLSLLSGGRRRGCGGGGCLPIFL